MDARAAETSGGRPTRRQCGTHLPALRDLPEDVLQMAAPLRGARRRRLGRPCASAAPLTAGDAGRGGEQNSLPSAALPLWSGQDCRLSQAVSRAVGGLCLGTPHSAPPWDESPPCQSEVPAARSAV